MKAKHAVRTILSKFPQLSSADQLELEAAIFNIIAEDRRSKLGELQGAFAVASSSNDYRSIADTVLLDCEDLRPRCCSLFQSRLNFKPQIC